MPDPDWQPPYASHRAPALARNAIATSQPLAAQAGLAMLASGGNAVDAALAAAIALTIVEPTGNGIGSDAFAIVWDGTRLHGLNGSGRAPAGWTPDRFDSLDGMPASGWDSVTVPGAVSAWKALSERLGRLPFANLFEPAIQYATDGYPVTPVIARQWAAGSSQFRRNPSFASTFLPDGHAPEAGHRFRFPDAAATLRRIAETDGADFYHGELATRIAAHARECGGAMTEQDLAANQPEWVEPIGCEYAGCKLYELPPNGQGVAAQMMLGIAGQAGLEELQPDSADAVHLQIEAMKLAFADVYRHVADSASMQVDAADLVAPGYLGRRAREIDMTRARWPVFDTPRQRGTVLVAAADAGGMMVTLIQSNFCGFGSGIVVPGTGISMHNRGYGFVLDAGHPNCVAPGKRPFHTILPAMVTREDEPVMAFGVMGGSMQPQGHAQLMVRIFDCGQDPQAAIDAPRWRIMPGQTIAVENGFSAGVAAELERRGHTIRFMDPEHFGGAQAVFRREHACVGASDPRRDGQALGC